MDSQCRKFVQDIFAKYDKDRSGVLERKELKDWIREELKAHKFLKKDNVKNEYDVFFSKTDINGDGKIDRW